MIKKFEITGVHTVPDDQIKDYLTESIAKLEHLLPRKARESVHVDAKLIESRSQGNKKFTAEVILHLPHDTITAKASTTDMPEAIDLVENKLTAQLKKYKETNTNPKLLRRLRSRISPTQLA